MKRYLKAMLLTGFSILGLVVVSRVDASARQAGTLNYTRYDMEQMLKEKKQSKYRIPNFKASKIDDLYSANDDFDKGYDGEPLDVWDSWPLKNSSGKVAVVNGYRIVFALAGNPNKKIKNRLNGRIVVFCQKASDAHKGADSWQYAGPVFTSNTDGVNPDSSSYEVFKHETGEWSGSASLQSNGKIRLMYTSFSGFKDYGGYGDNRQTLATAQIALNFGKKYVAVDHSATTDRKAVFSGDNNYYEDVQHSTDVTGFSHDDHTLRDPELIHANGKNYLLFEGNTAAGSGPLGNASLNHMSYYGGNAKFKAQQKALMKKNPLITTWNGKKVRLKSSAADSNGCLGLLELDDNYNVEKILPPLVTFNLVEDETERPSAVYHNGRWYIFTAMHGWHMSSPNVNYTDSFMLGFSSKSLTGGYQPLNKYGLVAYGNQKITSRTFTYSYSMNQTASNPFLLTSYITQLGGALSDSHSTFAPTIKVNLNGSTSNVQKSYQNQGQLVQ